MATRADPPLIAIVGPTSSGKTDLAIKLAKRFNGAIICADSRTVYRDFDIGSAKPTVAEMDCVPHYMLNVVKLNEQFSLYDFQRLANKYIKEIRRKGQIPFLVGGSGLYVDSILFDYQLGPEPDSKLRQMLNKMSVHDLLELLKEQHIEIPSNFNNKRHLIRAIEQNGVNRTQHQSIIDNAYVVGISTDKDVIEKRIRDRAIQMLGNGLVEETRQLIEEYGDVEPLRNNSMGEAQKFLRGEVNRDDLIERMVIVDRQLAKKQMTWFRRNKQIKWLPLDEAEKYVVDLLTSHHK